MTHFTVAITGDGVASACCAHLLGKAGIAVSLTPGPKATVPAILLSRTAIALLRDIFDAPDLLADLPPVARRIVRWGDAEPVSVPHDAFVVSGRKLLDALHGDAAGAAGAADFTVHTTLPGGPTRRFGAREAAAVRVDLQHAEDGSACMVESAAAGWLFLLPDGTGAAWLLGIGVGIDALLEESRLIAPRLGGRAAGAQAFDACPRIAEQPIGDRWLACGTAAVAFDPICGDGVAQAVREAILASATIMAIAEGHDPAPRLAHYRATLIAAMRRHLQLCRPFYTIGGPGDWWTRETIALAEGHAWCTAQLELAGEPQFRLDGFRLSPRVQSAP